MKYVSFLLLIFFTSCSFAHEPENLSILKQKLEKYHDSGTYEKDIANVMQKAMRYLELRINQKNFTGKPAIVLDIDETALSNYPNLINRNFGGTREEIIEDEKKGNSRNISATLKLYRFAKANKVAVFFITGRQEEERQSTELNLKKEGYVDYDDLFLRTEKTKNVSAVVFKTQLRKQLENFGYDIILNIGDQVSDLSGGYADKTFKLPNPYYYIP